MKRFKEWGQQGGRKRALRLSPVKRSLIASRAARMRWKKSSKSPDSLYQSVRLYDFSLEDPVYLQEILSEGTMDDWKKIHDSIVDKPFGSVAKALDKVLSAEKIYGVTPLWRGILKNLQGDFS